ncbi:MAG: ComF family protein [Acidobacteria bacterium]|nr:ComF family protein [Acidobacteriota bacterium]
MDIAVDIRSGYTAGIGRAGVFLALPRVRLVFSESVKDLQLDNGCPSGRPASPKGGEALWRTVNHRMRDVSRLGTALNKIIVDLANLFTPSDCRVCQAPLLQTSAVRICQVCVERLEPEEGSALDPRCTRCGDALGMESARFIASMGISECTMCRLAPPEFDKAVSFTDYNGEIREMLHLLKFKGMHRIAEHVLGRGMAIAIQKLRHTAASEVLVVPVPLFAAKRKERGFNQSTLLAVVALKRLQHVEKEWMLSLQEQVLERTKDTRALYMLNPSQRRRSLQGAFRVPDATAVKGREVLLIDDIMTTGATARECARVLKRAGATRVWVATAAKAQPESVHSVIEHGAESFALWDATVGAKAATEPASDRRFHV